MISLISTHTLQVGTFSSCSTNCEQDSSNSSLTAKTTWILHIYQMETLKNSSSLLSSKLGGLFWKIWQMCTLIIILMVICLIIFKCLSRGMTRQSCKWLLWCLARVGGFNQCASPNTSKNTGVGGHALLQGIFPTQGSNPCLLHLLHWQAGSLPLHATWETHILGLNKSQLLILLLN